MCLTDHPRTTCAKEYQKCTYCLERNQTLPEVINTGSCSKIYQVQIQLGCIVAREKPNELTSSYRYRTHAYPKKLDEPEELLSQQRRYLSICVALSVERQIYLLQSEIYRKHQLCKGCETSNIPAGEPTAHRCNCLIKENQLKALTNP